MSIYINQLIQQLNLPNTFISTTHSNSYLLTAKLEPLPVGGVHRFRTGPDRPGSKTEYRVGGGPGTGLDRSDQDCPFAFCWPTMRHGLPMPNGTTTLPLSQNFFFFCIRTVRSNLQMRDFLASNAARSTRAEWHDRLLPRKKFFFLLKFGPSVRSNPGPDRRPNSAFCWTEDRTEEDRSGASQSSVRSDFGPKTAHP